MLSSYITDNCRSYNSNYSLGLSFLETGILQFLNSFVNMEKEDGPAGFVRWSCAAVCKCPSREYTLFLIQV